MATQMAHTKTANGGVPEQATQLGWTEQKAIGELSSWRSNGPQLGWVDAEADEFLFDPNVLPFVRKHSNGQLAVTPQTFVKRLKDSGLLVRVDATRSRNTVRMTLEKHPRQVIVLKLSDVLAEESL